MKNLLALIILVVANSDIFASFENDLGPCKFSKNIRFYLEEKGIEIETVRENYPVVYQYSCPDKGETQTSEWSVLILESGKILLSTGDTNSWGSLPPNGSEMCYHSILKGYVYASFCTQGHDHGLARSFVPIANRHEPQILRTLVEIRGDGRYVFDDGFVLTEKELFDITKLPWNGVASPEIEDTWQTTATTTCIPKPVLTISYNYNGCKEIVETFLLPDMIDQKGVLHALVVGDAVVFRSFMPCENSLISEPVYLVNKVAQVQEEQEIKFPPSFLELMPEEIKEKVSTIVGVFPMTVVDGDHNKEFELVLLKDGSILGVQDLGNMAKSLTEQMGYEAIFVEEAMVLITAISCRTDDMFAHPQVEGFYKPKKTSTQHIFAEKQGSTYLFTDGFTVRESELFNQEFQGSYDYDVNHELDEMGSTIHRAFTIDWNLSFQDLNYLDYKRIETERTSVDWIFPFKDANGLDCKRMETHHCNDDSYDKSRVVKFPESLAQRPIWDSLQSGDLVTIHQFEFDHGITITMIDVNYHA